MNDLELVLGNLFHPLEYQGRLTVFGKSYSFSHILQVLFAAIYFVSDLLR